MITALGLNHKTAPVDLREKLAFNSEQISDALTQLKKQYPDSEFILLSTCNRVEIYSAGSKELSPTPDDLTVFLTKYCSVDSSEFKNCLYCHHNEQAVKHLLEVSSSLDSLIIGESQIIAQVKESFRLANVAKSTGKILNRLFHCAFSTSKEVYTLTTINQRRISVAGVAVDLAQQLFNQIKTAQIAVIGAGEMGELIVRHLLDIGCQNITVYNRTFSRALSMSGKYDIKSGEWSNLQQALHTTDIIVAAATAEDHLFDKEYLTGRHNGPLLIIDIAVPRNFAPDVETLNDVYLYSVDDLAQVIQDNIEARQEDIGQAQAIITDNVESFMDWFGIKDIGPMVGELRRSFQALSKDELNQFLSSEPEMTPLQKQKMEAAANRIVNKITHRLINTFHNVAKTHSPDEATKIIDSIINYKDRQ